MFTVINSGIKTLCFLSFAKSQCISCVLYSAYIIGSFNIRRGPNHLAGNKTTSKKPVYKLIVMDAHEIFEFINIDKYINEYKYRLQQFIHLLLLWMAVIGMSDYLVSWHKSKYTKHKYTKDVIEDVTEGVVEGVKELFRTDVKVVMKGYGSYDAGLVFFVVVPVFIFNSEQYVHTPIWIWYCLQLFFKFVFIV